MRSRTGIAALIAVASWVFLVVTGVSAMGAVALVVVVAVQGVSGAIVWQALRRAPVEPVESIGMGLAIGTALAVIAGVVVRAAGLGGWGWALPAVVAALAWLVRRIRRGTARQTVTATRDSVVALVVASVLGLLSLAYNVRPYPLHWSGSWSGFHGDMLFFEAVASSLSTLGPGDSIFMSGAVLRYHWLTYAWAGQVTSAVGTEPFVVMTRVLPLVTVIAASCIVIAWSRRLSRVAWVPTLAVALLLAGGYVGATYGTILNFDSPSQSMSTVWLLAASLGVVTFVGRQPQANRGLSTGWLALLAVFGFATTAGKVSVGAITLAGVGLVAVVALARREPGRAAAVGALLATGIGVAAGYVLVVSGSADPGGLRIASLLDRASSVQGLNPIYTSLGVLVGTGVLAIAVMVRWAGLAWLVADRRTRWRTDTVLGLGFAIGGLATLLLLSGGMNDTWFALAASGPLVALSAAGAGQAALAVGATDGGWRPARTLAWAVVAALALAGVVTALWAQGPSGGNVWVSTVRWLGPPVGLLGAVVAGWVLARRRRRRRGLVGSIGRRWLALTVLVLVVMAAPVRLLGVAASAFGTLPGSADALFTPREPFVVPIDMTTITEITADDMDAAQWLRDHVSDSDLLITNTTFSPLVPALTALPTYVSGMQYQAPYGRVDALDEIVRREQSTWTFIESPNATVLSELCDAGVRWAWVKRPYAQRSDWTPFATIAHQNDTVTVLSLACPQSG